jgi:lysophospholipase L1-like esterase
MASNSASASTSAARSAVQGVVRPQYFDPNISYPTQLLGLLRARFPGQAFTMENEGRPGETAAGGYQRLVDCFATGDRPDVFLLLEGINDIGGFNNYAPTFNQQQGIVQSLKDDATLAASRGASYIFLATILPVRTCPFESDQACRVGDYGDSTVPNQANASINAINAMIRTTGIGATIVDANAAFKAADPTLQSLIGQDGLHPTQAGYAVLATAWMNAITSKVPITSLRRVR